MNDIRVIDVLLAGLPSLLEEIVDHVLDAEPDFRVSAVKVHDTPLIDAILLSSPNVLIMGTDRPPPADAILGLLEALPRLKVFTIQGNGQQAELYELTPERHSLGMISPTHLVTAIREAATKSRVPESWSWEIDAAR